MFPTYRLYLCIFGDTFFFSLILLSLTLLLSTRDNETIRSRLTIGKSPVARTARSVCSRTVDTPTDDLQCFPYVNLFVAGRNNIHRPLPSAPASLTQECDFSTIYSNFQNILVAFFHNRDILTYLATKNLSYRSVGRCLQYCPVSARSDSWHSLALLGVCSDQRAAKFSAGRNAADSSVNHLQNSVSKHLLLTDCLDL